MNTIFASSMKGNVLVVPLKTRVIIADAHACVRELITMAMKVEGGCQVIGQTGLGAEVFEMCGRQEPELVILDPRLPDMPGGELIRLMRRRHGNVRVLVLSSVCNRETTLDVLDAGPHGFVHKEEPLSVFFDVFRAVLRGSRYFSEHGVRLMAPSPHNGNGRAERDSLTPRQREVLRRLAHGRSNKEIAHDLHIAPKTVDKHRTNLMAKLNIHEVAGLTRYAVAKGLTDPDG